MSPSVGFGHRQPPQADSDNLQLSSRSILKDVNNSEASFTPPLGIVFQFCLSVLRQLAPLLDPFPRQIIGNAAARLQLWSTGMFEKQASLDDVLIELEGSRQPLRNCLVHSLAAILLVERELRLRPNIASILTSSTK